jgi:hypothetical protein
MELALLGLVILFAAGGITGYALEKRDWNGGVSPAGIKWRRFDTDSQGGRGYTDGTGNYCWISYPRVDALRREE